MSSSATTTHRVGVFIAVVTGALAVSLDFASVDLALPAIERDLGLDLDGVQWVINGYMMAFAILMVTGGRLADAVGRKRIFLIGAAIFGLSSLAGGFAWSGASLVALRIAQGLGGALLWPAMIGIACQAVSERHRGFAMGLVLGTCSIGNAAGPVLGGALTEWLSWRWVLWVNVPMAALAILVMAVATSESPRTGERQRSDYAGMLLLTGGLVALMISVDQGPVWGWATPLVLGLLACGVSALVAFPFVESRVASALVPPALMRNAEFVSLCVVAATTCQLFLLILIYVPQYAMKFLGDSAIVAGARVAPFMAGFGLVSFLGGFLYARVGPRRLIVAGSFLILVGALGIALLGPGVQDLRLSALLGVLGLDVGAVVPSGGTRAVEVAGVERASLAGGVNFMSQLAGAALLLAAATSVYTMSSDAALRAQMTSRGIVMTPAEEATASNLLDGPGRTRGRVASRTAASEALRDELDAAAAAAYRRGFRDMLLFSSAAVAAGLVLTLVFVHGRKRGERVAAG